MKTRFLLSTEHLDFRLVGKGNPHGYKWLKVDDEFPDVLPPPGFPIFGLGGMEFQVKKVLGYNIGAGAMIIEVVPVLPSKQEGLLNSEQVKELMGSYRWAFHIS